MNTDIKINFPDEIVNEMNFEENIFSTAKTDLMISTFSEINGYTHVLRVYQMLYNKFNETYEFVQELAAFSFGNRTELVSFLKKLPDLNGLEMLMLLNPVEPEKKRLN